MGRREHQDEGRRAAIYARISEDRTGAGLGVDRQVQDCKALAEQLGWQVVATYVDNDVSAYRGRVRPGYRALLQAIDAGTVSAVLTWHSDRLHRSPVELEDYVAKCEQHGVVTHTVKAGVLDLATPSGRMVARQLGAVARFEVEHKSERTRRAQLQAAEAGRWLGGCRPFGWQLVDGVPHVDKREAAELGDVAGQFLAGASLNGIIRKWNADGLTTTTGRTWSYATLRQLLLRPRNAGHITYQGEIVARDAWPAILDEDTWLAVRQLLSDPSRRTTSSNRAKWLLSGIARCGVCGGRLRSFTVGVRSGSKGRRTVYRCCVARAAPALDDYISQLVVDRLSRPDAAAELLVDRDSADRDRQRQRCLVIRERLDGLAQLYAEGHLPLAAVQAESDRLKAELRELESARSATVDGAVLSELLTAEDVQATWDQLALDRRRAVVRVLMEITVQPTGRTGKAFRPEMINVDWK